MSMIPKEIHGLLNSEEGKFLLVKGKAGVGKTMFCLELIKEFGGLYVSTIVTAEQLYKDCPGLEDSIPKDFILDATMYTTPNSAKLRDMETDIDDSILREILYETSSEGHQGPVPPPARALQRRHRFLGQYILPGDLSKGRFRDRVLAKGGDAEGRPQPLQEEECQPGDGGRG